MSHAPLPVFFPRLAESPVVLSSRVAWKSSVLLAHSLSNVNESEFEDIKDVRTLRVSIGLHYACVQSPHHWQISAKYVQVKVLRRLRSSKTPAFRRKGTDVYPRNFHSISPLQKKASREGGHQMVFYVVSSVPTIVEGDKVTLDPSPPLQKL
jgi:hypothetical protein